MNKTHHNATFIALATDGEDCIVGIAENGESALGTFTSLEWVARHISQNVVECIDADRPLIVVVGKNKTRATAGEVFELDGVARQELGIRNSWDLVAYILSLRTTFTTAEAVLGPAHAADR